MSSLTASVDVTFEPLKPLHPAVKDATTPRASRFRPQTPTPSTPELCWDDTPALSTIVTPGDEYDSDGGVPVDISPSVARRNRSKLRAVLDLDVYPSKEFRTTRIFDDNPLPITGITALIEDSSPSARTETVSLHQLQDQGRSEDVDDGPLPEEESTRMDETSFIQTASTSQENAVKPEEKSHTSDHQISNEPDHIISSKDSCEDEVSSVIFEFDHKIPSETTSAEIAVSKLDVDSTLSDVEASCTPTATDTSEELAVIWGPSQALCRALPCDFVERLRAEPIYCISTTTRNKRCRNKNGAKLTMEKVNTLLSELLGSSLLKEASSTIQLVEDLAIQAMCKNVHLRVVEAELAVLKEYSKVRDTEENPENASEAAEGKSVSDHSSLAQWLQGLLQAHIPEVQQQSSTELKVTAEMSAILTKPELHVTIEEIVETTPLFTKQEVALEVDSIAKMPTTPTRRNVKVEVDVNSEVLTDTSHSQVAFKMDAIAEMPPIDTQNNIEINMGVVSEIDARSTQPSIKLEMGMSAGLSATPTQSLVLVEKEVGAEAVPASMKPQVGVSTVANVAMPPSSTQFRAKDDPEGKVSSASTPFTTKHERTVDDDTPTKRLRYRGTRQQKLDKPQRDLSQVSTFASVINVNWAARKLRSEPRLPWSPDYATLSAHLRYKFEPYTLRGTRQNISDAELIRHWLERPLARTDVDQEGYICLFWHPGNFGFLKIGRTNDINKRLRKWQSQCKIEVKQVIEPDQSIQSPVRHPIRVEQLIHAELHSYRLQEPKCIGCSKKHVEWFKADPALALRVVKKWSHVPVLYEEGRLSKSLTEVEIKALCQVTTLEKIARTPSKPSRRSLGRHSVVEYPMINHFSIGEDGALDAPAWMKPLAT
ncbi:hypothetical protein LTR84_003431 [Exophiala bonariae]|uniref:Bacteriophage T5 Orf172 DNA-binding domain-containing protein n=1 Tax=Exophiala bonariae TaxID=1690606 RepID=A0AAV9N739_9EURO|nr:hypothetical protein LTR84_003431 [Exophiala bonariae]